MKLTPETLIVVHPSGLEDEELKEDTARLAGMVEERLVEARKEIETVRKDPRLTPQGKGGEALRVGEHAVESVARICRLTRQGHEAEASKLKKEILDARVRLKVPAGIDPDDARAAEAATRQLLLQMDETERQLTYERALDMGDAVTVRSMELLPPSVRPVTVPDDAAERYAAAAFPEKWGRLESLRMAMDHASWCARWGGQLMTKLVGADEALEGEEQPTAELEGPGAE